MGTTLTIALPILGGIICAFIGAFGTYVAVKRKNSGKIETSEASELWQESQAMRKELRDEVVYLRGRVTNLETAMVEQQKEIQRLRIRVKEVEG